MNEPNIVASIALALAVLHSAGTNFFARAALKCKAGSSMQNIFELLSEVEVAFAMWASLYLAYLVYAVGYVGTSDYLASCNFTEPAFIIMMVALCFTKPILEVAELFILWLPRHLSVNRSMGQYVSMLTLGPLLGSFITEPAAMTITAVLLARHYFHDGWSVSFKYCSLAVLFVNISVGGTLTPYAAPPVLMVARSWGFDLPYMFLNFGLKGVLVCVVNALGLAWWFREEFMKPLVPKDKSALTPLWLRIAHVCVLVLIVIFAHNLSAFTTIFLAFLVLHHVTSEHQTPLRIQEGVLVGMFLASVVILSGPQSWWLEPLMTGKSRDLLFFGSLGMSALMDNAAITYMGSLIPVLPEASRYALLAGAVCGGGLTVLANAPNPAGFLILKPFFGPTGISSIQLFRYALLPTLIAAFCFYF
ncbi:MAG: putative Na+/H+ antiporter [Myxococcota bacterium]